MTQVNEPTLSPGDLILKIRLDALKQNLELVKDFLYPGKKRRGEVRELKQLLAGLPSVRADARKVLSRVRESKERLGDVKRLFRDRESKELLRDMNVDRQFDEIIVSLGEAETMTDSILSKQLQRAEAIIDEMEQRFVSIEDMEMDLSDTVTREAGNDIQKIGHIEELLLQVKGASEATKVQELRQKVWKDYGEGAARSQRIFAEYVDFLHGMSLRDNGMILGDNAFEDWVFQMADEWMKTCVRCIKKRNGRLTIPAYRETMTMENLIHLEFEWTIWAIPFTAHEFWSVVREDESESTEKPFETFIQQHPLDGRSSDYMQHCMADAFATYTMGPAYVCASVLMRLNPLLANDDRPERPNDDIRAQIMFTMLEWMNTRVEGCKPYDGIIERLRNEWDTAISQAQLSAKRTDGQAPDALKTWVHTLGEVLGNHIYIEYKCKRFQAIEPWVEQLLQNEGQEIQVGSDAEVRDVLNAAWLCRVNHPESTRAITCAARKLSERIIRQSSGASRGGAQPNLTARNE